MNSVSLTLNSVDLEKPRTQARTQPPHHTYVVFVDWCMCVGREGGEAGGYIWCMCVGRGGGEAGGYIW